MAFDYGTHTHRGICTLWLYSYRMSWYSGLISSNCAAQFRYQQASLGTGHGATGVLPSAGRQLGIQRMRGLSTTGHFYGHSNAHKTLDVLSGWCWCRLCVCVCVGLCLGKFLNANHIYESSLQAVQLFASCSARPLKRCQAAD